MVPPDDHAVAIMIPPAMPAAVMSVELHARGAIVLIAIVIIRAAADAETETLSARDCRRRNRDTR
jgi:hypothetical protein